MALDKEKLIESLYTRCAERSATSKQVFAAIVKDLGLIGTSVVEEKAIDIIRPYKQSGKNLELTSNLLYDILNTSNSSGGLTWG